MTPASYAANAPPPDSTIATSRWMPLPRSALAIDQSARHHPARKRLRVQPVWDLTPGHQGAHHRLVVLREMLEQEALVEMIARDAHRVRRLPRRKQVGH